MAQYIVNPDKFVKIAEKSGFLYIKQGSGIEVCTDNVVAGTGVVVLKTDTAPFGISADNIYIRALREKTVVNCVASNVTGGGGGTEITEADITEQDIAGLFD